jgi:hypothetical protein
MLGLSLCIILSIRAPTVSGMRVSWNRINRRPGEESSKPSGPSREVPRADTEGSSAKVAGMIQTQLVKPATNFTVQESCSRHSPILHEGKGTFQPCHRFLNTQQLAIQPCSTIQWRTYLTAESLSPLLSFCPTTDVTRFALFARKHLTLIELLAFWRKVLVARRLVAAQEPDAAVGVAGNAKRKTALT